MTHYSAGLTKIVNRAHDPWNFRKMPVRSKVRDSRSVRKGLIRRSLLGCLLLIAPSTLQAQSFCRDLQTMISAAPAFASLRGRATGSEFDGSLKFSGAEQCDIRNKTELDDNWQQVGSEKWTYECLWGEQAPAALAALKARVKACLPDARYRDGSRLTDYAGGIFRYQELSVAVDYGPSTKQLWLTVFPAGVDPLK
jgi:hypothetical protein